MKNQAAENDQRQRKPKTGDLTGALSADRRRGAERDRNFSDTSAQNKIGHESREKWI
jgi:hypothetical protein